MEILLVRLVPVVLVLVLVSVERSECVRCFSSFTPGSTEGQCDGELGEVDIDDCCQNIQYGYQATDGVCKSCGIPTWSSWSPWSPCNVCGAGVTQRHRTCFGISESECEGPQETLQTQACNGTCCGDSVWGPWLAWTPCSVTCGGGGVRKRVRVCPGPPECSHTCSGSAEQTEDCPTHTCPVHGGWSRWSGWSHCSGSCISGSSVPSRRRDRACTNPTPSNNTTPHGNGCQGDQVQHQDCSELPNCPVDGGWGEWSAPTVCSVSCGEGLQQSTRKCDNPAPKYGGRSCDGPSTRVTTCKTVCPVDGVWSGWSSWGDCSSGCVSPDLVPVRRRHRSCSNPAPSASPPGKNCQGDSSHAEDCVFLPYCPVNGGWGPWSPMSPCSVTCGVGLQVSNRKCDHPAPKQGGKACPGEGRQTRICKTDVHCPVEGVWSQWSPWQKCKEPFQRKFRVCSTFGGSQMRQRECQHRAHNGSTCDGNLSESRVCYDVNGCGLPGTWDVWEQWSLCKPACGSNSRRTRKRICNPDYSRYSPTIGRLGEKATFFGKPILNCGPTPDGGPRAQAENCVNVPPCT